MWAIILVLKDFSWISDRTHALDAFGVGAYALVLAFFESAFVFIVLLLLGLFLPKKWPEKNRVALLGALMYLVSLWAILGQLFFIMGAVTPFWIVQSLSRMNHPLRFLYLAIFLIVFPSVLLPMIALVRSGKVRDWLSKLNERIVLLSSFYIFLDLIGLVVIIIRNVG